MASESVFPANLPFFCGQRRIALANVRVDQEEAAKREAEEAFAQAAESASEAARSFDLSRPELPTISFAARIRSQTKRGTCYEVDLGGPTCTCPRFSLIPTQAQREAPYTLLHIFDAYAQLEPSAGWTGWLGAFLTLSWTPHPRQKWQVLSMTQGWLIFRQPARAA